jgi:hypothetical protein
MHYRTTWTPEKLTPEQHKNSVEYYCSLIGHELKHSWIFNNYGPTTTSFELKTDLILFCNRCKEVQSYEGLSLTDRVYIDNLISDKIKQLRQQVATVSESD